MAAEIAETETATRGQFLVGLSRAFAGALIFSVPMFMTMEMWSIGFYIDPFRLALLLFLLLPLLTGLSRIGGFRNNAHILDDVADALVAIAVATVSALVVLLLFNLLTPHMPLREILGKLAVQIFTASFGAMLAQNQLGSGTTADRKQVERNYWGELLLLGTGGLFLSLNIAPTEEVQLIAVKMTVWHAVTIVLLSIALLHAIVYTVDFAARRQMQQPESFFSVFLRFTLAGYALVALLNLYLLWTFGRTDGLALEELLRMLAVLSFPAAIGAAFARLIL